MDDAPAGKQWLTVPVQERRKWALGSLVALLAGTGLVWAMQLSSDQLTGYWWYVWPLWAVLGPAVPFYWFRKRRLVPTAEATTALAAKEAEAQRKNAELERKWWFRYGVAALLLTVAWYVVERNGAMWWLSALLVLGAAGYAKELALAVLGVALVVAVFAGLAALPVSVAIVLGAAMIAYGVMRSKDPDLDTRLPVVGKYFLRRREAKQLKELLANPFFSTLQSAVQVYWTDEPAHAGQVNAELQEQIRKQLIEEGLAIAAAEHPAMENRKRLAEAVMETARLQVLVIPPPPEEDSTAIRGKFGVSGELKAHLLELARENKQLREWLAELPTQTWGDVWAPVLMRYWVVLARANVLAALRRPLDDYDPARQPDWYQLFLQTQCGFQEDEFRECLGLPRSLPPEPGWGNLTSLKYSMFVNCVIEGAKYPDEDWRARCAKVEQGDEGPSPEGSDLAPAA